LAAWKGFGRLNLWKCGDRVADAGGGVGRHAWCYPGSPVADFIYHGTSQLVWLLKRTADLFRHFYLALHSAASDERWVKAGQDFFKRKGNPGGVLVGF
jgi:hypothetical protein